MTQFQADLSKPLNINGVQSCKAYYNLVISIRDVGMFSQIQMKPHRGWRITDVKNYFGVKGSSAKVLTQLKDLKKEYFS